MSGTLNPNHWTSCTVHRYRIPDPFAMRHVILILIIALFGPTLAAQGPDMIPAINWMAAHKATFGPAAGTEWLQDLNVEDMEVYTTGTNSLVLVDRSESVQEERPETLLRATIQNVGGTDMRRVGPAERTEGQVWMGTYRGSLSGTWAEMRQYVQVQDGRTTALVRIISPGVNGTRPVEREQEPIVSALLGEQLGSERTVMVDR